MTMKEHNPTCHLVLAERGWWSTVPPRCSCGLVRYHGLEVEPNLLDAQLAQTERHRKLMSGEVRLTPDPKPTTVALTKEQLELFQGQIEATWMDYEWGMCSACGARLRMGVVVHKPTCTYTASKKLLDEALEKLG